MYFHEYRLKEKNSFDLIFKNIKPNEASKNIVSSFFEFFSFSVAKKWSFDVNAAIKKYRQLAEPLTLS